MALVSEQDRMTEEERKAARAETAKKHAAKVKADRAQDKENAVKLKKELEALQVFSRLSDGMKLYLEHKINAEPGVGGRTFFNVVFGDSPVVGQTKTLKDIILGTRKGMETMNLYMKKWAKTGTEVSMTLNKEDLFATTYTIKKIG